MNFSIVIRRIHMYLALFFIPWILMYALSTMAVNHRNLLEKIYGGPMVRYEKEKELRYTASFPPDAEPPVMAEHILADLDMEGRYIILGNPGRGALTIVRWDPMAMRRIRYTPADGTLVVEREVFRVPLFLFRFHQRAGFQDGLVMENVWASSVDLVIVAMIFWVLSGLWMWWELKVVRGWGTICVMAGVGLFAVFLFTI